MKKRTTKRKPGSSAHADENGERARDVLLERIESQMQVVVESVMTLSAQLDVKLTALESRLAERISTLEQVVRQNSLDIRKNSDEIRKNSDDIRAVQIEVAQLRRDFDRRGELARMSALEERVARVEAKLGIAS